MPVACESCDNEIAGAAPVHVFKDGIGAIKRLAENFRLFRNAGAGDPVKFSLSKPDMERTEWAALIARKKPVRFTFPGRLGELEFGPGNSKRRPVWASIMPISPTP